MIKKPLVSNILGIGWSIPCEERWCRLGPEKFEFGLRRQGEEWIERGGHIRTWYVFVEDRGQVPWTSPRREIEVRVDNPSHWAPAAAETNGIQDTWSTQRSAYNQSCFATHTLIYIVAFGICDIFRGNPFFTDSGSEWAHSFTSLQSIHNDND